MAEILQVRCDPTPNPDAKKYSLNRKIIEKGSKTFHVNDNSNDPLASKLFKINGVKSLFFLDNFISVSRDSSVSWEEISPLIEKVLKSHFSQAN